MFLLALAGFTCVHSVAFAAVEGGAVRSCDSSGWHDEDDVLVIR